MFISAHIIGQLSDKVPPPFNTLRPRKSLHNQRVNDRFGCILEQPSGNSNISGIYCLHQKDVTTALGEVSGQGIFVVSFVDTLARAIAYDVARLCTHLSQIIGRHDPQEQRRWSQCAKTVSNWVKKSDQPFPQELPQHLLQLSSEATWEDMFIIMENSLRGHSCFSSQVQALMTRNNALNILSEQYYQLMNVIENIKQSLQDGNKDNLLKALNELLVIFQPQRGENENTHNMRIREILSHYYLNHSELRNHFVNMPISGVFYNSTGNPCGICQESMFRCITIDDIMKCPIPLGDNKERIILFLKANGIAIESIHRIIGKGIRQ